MNVATLSSRRRKRRGASSWTVIWAVVGLTIPLSVVIWNLAFLTVTGETPVDLVMGEVTHGPFVHEVWERGEVESSSNIEVRCEVRSRNSSGTSILMIVPEGTIVKKDQVIVRLDDSALRTDQIQQEILCSNSESAVIESKATLDGAIISLQEYDEGTFLQEVEQLESDQFVAKEDLRRAEEFLRYSEKLAERGYVSGVQLEADEFAVKKARKELDVAETKLTVLQNFTKKKMLTQLQANIDTARARLRAREKTWELDKVQLVEVEQQITKCVIVAPSDGQVVYANDPNRRSSSGDLLIDEGRPVRERQVIVRLPDPSKMRVVTKVHESRISNLEIGLPASIVLDAFPDDPMAGKVVEISEYPLPSVSSYTSHIKEYEVQVEISSPPLDLRPGMSAEVTVTVEQLDDATQVPIQAVLERNHRFFSALQDATGRLVTREIKIGSVNDETAVVVSGLTVGESVILSPYEIEPKLDLPDKFTAGSQGTGKDS